MNRYEAAEVSYRGELLPSATLLSVLSALVLAATPLVGSLL